MSHPEQPVLDGLGRAFLDPTIWRPGTVATRTRCRFIMGNGGLGDFICLLSCLEWIDKTQHQLIPETVCHDFVKPIAQRVLKRFKVLTFDEVDKTEKVPTKFAMSDNVNATGFNMVDIGYCHYANLDRAPEGWGLYPRLDVSDISYPISAKRYAVMTPGATTDSRTMPIKVFNEIKNHIISLGITPVFLGKRHIEAHHKARFLDYDYSGGIDLLNKTDLLQAKKIIDGSVFIIGLDNGLLHLAAMGEAPIIFGYNIASPHHRQPRRKEGMIINVTPPPQLECRFCQSRMRFLMSGHEFKNCLYKDLKCLDMMPASLYIQAIDMLMDSVQPHKDRVEVSIGPVA